MSQQLNHVILAVGHEQLLDCASPSKLIEHMHLDIPYNWVWELDMQQLAQELASRAPDLKRLEFKCFLSLQSERQVPGPFAELATMITKLHPLLKKLVHRHSDDNLHLYYTFVTSDYKLGPQENPGLRECDGFFVFVKGSDLAKQEWDVDKSLMQFLAVDIEVLALCKANGLGKRWLEHGKEIITSLGFVPTNPSDFAGLNKHRAAQPVCRAKVNSSNAEDGHRQESARVKDGHGPHVRACKPMETGLVDFRHVKKYSYGGPEAAEFHKRQLHAADPSLPQTGRARTRESKLLEIEAAEQKCSNKRQSRLLAEHLSQKPCSNARCAETCTCRAFGEGQLDMRQSRSMDVHMLETNRQITESLAVTGDPMASFNREDHFSAVMSALRGRQKSFANSKVRKLEAVAGKICKLKVANSKGLANAKAMPTTEATRRERARALREGYKLSR